MLCGRRCQQVGCAKSAIAGGTEFCMAHGGGRRCQLDGCSKSAASGSTQFCVAHGA
jgi:hypothetical protein